MTERGVGGEISSCEIDESRSLSSNPGVVWPRKKVHIILPHVATPSQHTALSLFKVILYIKIDERPPVYMGKGVAS
jgi:hypothetical protein